MAHSAGDLGAEDLQLASFLAAGTRPSADHQSGQQGTEQAGQAPDMDVLDHQQVLAEQAPAAEVEQTPVEPYMPAHPVDIEVGAKVYHQNIGKGIGHVMGFESYTDDGYRRWKVTWANGGPKERPCSDRYMQAVIVENPCQPSGYRQPCICIRGKHYGRKGMAISKIPESNWWNVDFEPSSNPRLVNSTAVPGENLHCTAYPGESQPPDLSAESAAPSDTALPVPGPHLALLHEAERSTEAVGGEDSQPAACQGASAPDAPPGKTGPGTLQSLGSMPEASQGTGGERQHPSSGMVHPAYADTYQDQGNLHSTRPVQYPQMPHPDAERASAPEQPPMLHQPAAMGTRPDMGGASPAVPTGNPVAKNVAAARQRAAVASVKATKEAHAGSLPCATREAMLARIEAAAVKKYREGMLTQMTAGMPNDVSQSRKRQLRDFVHGLEVDGLKYALALVEDGPPTKGAKHC